MERSEETLSTRDLAETNEPAADQDALGTTTGHDHTVATTPSGVAAEPEPAGARDDTVAPPVADESVAPRHVNAPAGNDAPPAAATAGTATAGATGSATADGNGDAAPLLSGEASSSFQRHWEEVQTRFVDEPRGAVEAADGLVANLMKELAEGFAQERERLEAQWDRGEDISTEDLRVALQRYRSFFNRLLAA